MAFDPNLPNSQQQDFVSVLGAIRGNENDLNDRIKAQENLSLAATKNEVTAARGLRNTVNDRLNQSLDAHGDLKFDTLRSMMWPASNDIPAFVDSLSFTVNDNRTATYLPGLLLRFKLGSVYAYADISASSYAAGTDKTTVTLRRPVLTAALSAVSIGVAVLAREDINLPAINKLLASSANIVAVKVYDTRHDSDGGAWRKKCNHTSWYNETLNTATRGASREFPAIALIVAETDRLTIYDATQAGLQMWMVFNSGGSVVGALYALGYNPTVGSSITGIDILNGQLAITKKETSADWVAGLRLLDFPTETYLNYGHASVKRSCFGFDQRNGGFRVSQVSTSSLDRRTNSVAMAVLPGAPINQLTNLPVATIAIGTDTGTFVINDNQKIVVGARNSVTTVRGFTDKYHLLHHYSLSGDSGGRAELVPMHSYKTGAFGNVYMNGGIARGSGYVPSIPKTAIHSSAILDNNTVAFGVYGSGFYLADIDVGDPDKSMSAWIYNDFVTGWMPSGTVMATLANRKTTDWSFRENELTEIGAVTEAPVATNAELKAYSGFSAENYLTCAHSEDFDFGAGDWSILFWMRDGATTVNATDDIFALANDGTGKVIGGQALGGTGALRLYTDDGSTGSDLVDSISNVRSTGWHLACLSRQGSRILVAINGEIEATHELSQSGALTDSGTTLKIGTRHNEFTQGQISLFRLVSRALTIDQIRKIHRDERPMFEAGATVLLGGNPTDIQDMDFDKSTGQLLVASNEGVSAFNGMRRTHYFDLTSGNHLTTDTMRSVSGENNFWLIGSAAEAVALADEKNIREPAITEILQKPEILFSRRTTDATPTILWSLPVFEGEEFDVEISVRAKELANSPAERASYSKRASIYRTVGENVTVFSVDNLAADRETTASMDCVIEADTSNQLLRLKVTGMADKTMLWHGTAKLIGGNARWAK